MAGAVIFQVKRRVQEREVREQALCRNAAGQLEQVVIGVAGIIVNAFLHLEDVDREDRGFAVAQALLGRDEHAFGDHAPFGGRIGAVVDGGKRHLRTGAGVHGIQVMYQRLHGLVGCVVCLADSVLPGERGDFFCGRGIILLRKQADNFRVKAVGIRQAGPGAERLLCPAGQLAAGFQAVLPFAVDFDCLAEVVPVKRAEGLGDAGCQRIVKVRNRLPAVLVVLVGLHRDARQRGIRADVVRLTDVPVAGREPAVEQLDEVNLAAGRCQRQEIQVVDMDIALTVGFGEFRVQDEHLAELLRALGTVLEHGAHGSVAVDIGVLSFDVVFQRGLEG